MLLHTPTGNSSACKVLEQGHRGELYTNLEERELLEEYWASRETKSGSPEASEDHVSRTTPYRLVLVSTIRSQGQGGLSSNKDQSGTSGTGTSRGHKAPTSCMNSNPVTTTLLQWAPLRQPISIPYDLLMEVAVKPSPVYRLVS